MADINATDLTPETAATLDGSEEFVMFDNVEGKRGELDTVGDYIVQHCDADGNGNTAAQLAASAASTGTAAAAAVDAKVGTLASLTTTDKTNLVAAVNEVDAEVATKADESELSDYAKVDGAYEAMTVGNAEQLVSNIRVTDTDPYLFRTAGGSLEIGDREYPTLVGASVVKNQIVRNADFSDGLTAWYVGSNAQASVSGDVLTATKKGATPTGNQFIQSQLLNNIPSGHVVLCSAFLWSSIDTSTIMQIVQSSPWANVGHKAFTISSSKTYCGAIFKPTTGSPNQFVFNFDNNNELNIQCPQLIDLTQMLGSTVADYIYSLEQGTAGAGVAFCKKYGIGVGYTAYNAGTLQSTTPTKHTTVGFNQFDKSTAVLNASIDSSTGAFMSSSNAYRSDYMRALPNTGYKLEGISTSNNSFVAFYDADKNYISRTGATNWDVNAFTTPQNCWYIAFCQYVAGGQSTFVDTRDTACMHLVWDGERDGEHEPYTKHEYDLGNDTLRGVFELNNGELKANGDVKTADGTITRKFGYVDLGTLAWSKSGTSGLFVFNNPQNSPTYMNLPSSPSTAINAICSKYSVCLYSEADSKDKVIYSTWQTAASKYFAVKDSAYAESTAADFKTAMSGVYLVYELATPTEEEGTAFQSPQIVSNWGTEEYTEANGIVVGHSTEYPQDLKAKVESAPNNPSADGDYIVKRENGENAYVPLVIPQELPNAPSTDGTYRLKCTVSGGAATYSWEA